MIYKGDAGYLLDGNKADFDAYVKRGGGLVNLHDSLCGPDPAYAASLLGGGKKHGEVNYTLDAPIHYNVAYTTDPIMKDMSDITILDEAFYNMTWANNPAIHVLANVTIPGTKSAGTHKGEVVPQIRPDQHTVAGGSGRRAPSCGCKGTSTQTFRTTSCSECCCAASPGQERSPLMSW